jgi:hypothetical protein
MKEKIINFLKSKIIISFFKKKLSSKEKFTITLTLFIAYTFLISNGIPTFSEILSSLLSFCICYFILKRLISNDPLKNFINYWIVFLYLMAFIIILSSTIPSEIFFLIPLLYSFYWVKKYIQPNPNRIEIFQFFAVLIFYFLAIKLMPKADYSYFTILFIAINLILLTSTNILTKRVASILEIFGFIFLFFNLTTFPEIDEKSLYENYVAIGFMFVNLIGFVLIFFRTKSYLEKTKILLLIALTTLCFIVDKKIIYFLCYLINLALLSLIILQEKLKIYRLRAIFFSLNMAIFIIMFVVFFLMMDLKNVSTLRGSIISITSFLNLIILPILVSVSNRTLKKRKLKNGDRT